jgi:tricarballylate dehydrogenase
VRDNDGIREITAKAIVLTWRFEANVQMRTQHIGPLVGAAKVRGTPHNQGDGLRMALAIGALPWGQFERLPRHRSAPTGANCPRALTDRSNWLAICMASCSTQGMRFVDEGEGYESLYVCEVRRAIPAQPGAKAWQIFDQKVVHLLSRAIHQQAVRRHAGGTGRPADIDDKGQAVRTLHAFNGAARG